MRPEISISHNDAGGLSTVMELPGSMEPKKNAFQLSVPLLTAAAWKELAMSLRERFQVSSTAVIAKMTTRTATDKTGHPCSTRHGAGSGRGGRSSTSVRSQSRSTPSRGPGLRAGNVVRVPMSWRSFAMSEGRSRSTERPSPSVGSEHPGTEQREPGEGGHGGADHDRRQIGNRRGPGHQPGNGQRRRGQQ